VATLTTEADRKSRSVIHAVEDFDVERPAGTQRAAYNNLGDDPRRSLTANEPEVYYQPIGSVETRRSVCIEALVRWRHTLLGLLSPGKFNPPVEDTGLISLLGEQVSRRACADAVAVAPEVRRLFAKHISVQKLKLMGLLTTCIRKVHDFPTLVPSLKRAGARHVAVTRRAGAAAASNKGPENVARPRGNI
jgi:predicted signal transduction protein with EAL and GGDEF domain